MHVVNPGGSINPISHSSDDTERVWSGSRAWLTTISGNRHCNTSLPQRAALTDTLFAESRNTKYPWMTHIRTRCLRSVSATGRTDAQRRIRWQPRRATGRAGSTRCTGTLATTRTLPLESSVTPTPLTSPICGGCVPPAFASSRRATGRIRTLPDKWRSSTPTARVTAPICRRGSTVRQLRHEFCRRAGTTSAYRRRASRTVVQGPRHLGPTAWTQRGRLAPTRAEQ